MICETCRQEVESVNEADMCEDCHDRWVNARIAFWCSLYEAEKAAGLLKSREEYEQDLIDAGRGHLLRRG